jgi:hypothetical protein
MSRGQATWLPPCAATKLKKFAFFIGLTDFNFRHFAESRHAVVRKVLMLVLQTAAVPMRVIFLEFQVITPLSPIPAGGLTYLWSKVRL